MDIGESLQFASKKLTYSIRKHKRARQVRMTIYANGNLVITSPIGADENRILKFINSKKEWINKELQYFSKFQGMKIFKNTRKEYEQNKEIARKLVLDRLEHFNKFYGLTYNRISIKRQKTRWGSCSRDRNLNFNYKIALIKPEFADYIIVHELCHLKEFNHKKEFWELVAQTIPDYKRIRREIRRGGMTFYN